MASYNWNYFIAAIPALIFLYSLKAPLFSAGRLTLLLLILSLGWLLHRLFPMLTLSSHSISEAIPPLALLLFSASQLIVIRTATAYLFDPFINLLQLNLLVISLVAGCGIFANDPLFTSYCWVSLSVALLVYIVIARGILQRERSSRPIFFLRYSIRSLVLGAIVALFIVSAFPTEQPLSAEILTVAIASISFVIAQARLSVIGEQLYLKYELRELLKLPQFQNETAILGLHYLFASLRAILNDSTIDSSTPFLLPVDSSLVTVNVLPRKTALLPSEEC